MKETIVINSYVKNTEVALKKLLNSFPHKEINLIIFIGGNTAADYVIEQSESATTVYCPHNSIDFTGLISLIELEKKLKSFNHFFYLHDTCVAGKDFISKLKSINKEPSKSYSLKFPSMNMGIYEYEFLIQNKEKILEFKNLSHKEKDAQIFKQKCVKSEDFIFKLNEKNHIFLNSKRIVEEPCDYYKTGVLRRVEHYLGLDLYKIKANWSGSKTNYELRN